MNLIIETDIGHDPDDFFALCYLHPEIATWFPGKLYNNKGHWGTRPKEDADYIIADINREKLWDHIRKFY